MEHTDSDNNHQESQPNQMQDRLTQQILCHSTDSNNGDYSDNRNVEGGNNYHQGRDVNYNQYENSPDHQKIQDKGLSKHSDYEDSRFKTPATYKIESGPTLETENGYNTEATSPTKSQIKKGQHGRKNSTSKNFLALNKSVKTSKTDDLSNECVGLELFSAFSEKKKSRQSNVTDRYPGTANILMSRQNPTIAKKQTHQRQQDWHKVNQHSSWMQTQKQVSIQVQANGRQSQTAQKNESKDFVVKHIEISINTLMGRSSSVSSLGGTFSKNRREKWYHQTNSSSINNLRSYQSLDVPLGQEDKPFPTTKGNQALKRAMNQSQVFSKTNLYLNDDVIPDEFGQHRGRETVVHNVNNPKVQGMRLRNLSSNIF